MTEGRQAARRRSVGYMFGSDEQSGRAFAGGEDLRSAGNSDIRLLRSEADFYRLHIPRNFGRLRTKLDLSRVDVVFNLITDPDLNPNVLHWGERLLSSYPGRVINRPAAVRETSRDAVARRLQGIEGLTVPPVARFRGRPQAARSAIAGWGGDFPAILRPVGTHNGDIVGLVADEAALLAAIRPEKTYFLTQFVDSRGPDALYHKIRILFFGDEAVVRHGLISDHWNVHGPDRERVMAHHPAWMVREKAMLEGGMAALPPRAQRILAQVRARIPLDFFGVDFALLPDDGVLLFEANATMNFFPLSDDPRFAYAGEPVAARARHALERLIAAEEDGTGPS